MRKKLYFTLFSFLFCLNSFPAFSFSQNSSNELMSRAIYEKVSPSVVTILASKGEDTPEKVASGVIIRANGIILTSYSIVKDATNMQIRLKDGEIFDKVDLLGFDERRGVAALRITANNLPSVAINYDKYKSGEKIFLISNPHTISDGILGSFRLADEIPNMGKGFRVLQYSSTLLDNYGGGLLVDNAGLALGLVVINDSNVESGNFAIPVANIDGLAETVSIIKTFGTGKTLGLQQNSRLRSAAEAVKLPLTPNEMLKKAKFIYVYTYSDLIKSETMNESFLKNSEFKKLDLALVNEAKAADIVINVEHQLFTFNYHYTITDRASSVVLMSGTTISWDGKGASNTIVRELLKKIKTAKSTQSAAK